jgi:hypothetical protein
VATRTRWGCAATANLISPHKWPGNRRNVPEVSRLTSRRKAEGNRAWRKSGRRREGAEIAVPQDLHGMVKTALSEAQFHVGLRSTRWQSA